MIKSDHTIARFVRFSLVGGSGFVVDVLVFMLLSNGLGMDIRLARAIAFWVAASWTWFCNRRFTFSDRPSYGSPLNQWLRYLVASVLAFVPNWGCFTLLVTFLPWMASHPILPMAIGIGVGLVFNFLLTNLVIFKAE